MRIIAGPALAVILLVIALPVWAGETTATMSLVTPEGVGQEIGTVTLTDSGRGLRLKPDLRGLPPGVHGFHIHETPICSPGVRDGKPAAAMGAGGHFDPDKTSRHLGPEAPGHRGDLPTLMVDADGMATEPVTAPRLKVANVQGRALVIHAGGDTYADDTDPAGGGGARIACGVIK